MACCEKGLRMGERGNFFGWKWLYQKSRSDKKSGERLNDFWVLHLGKKLLFTTFFWDQVYFFVVVLLSLFSPSIYTL